MSKLCAVPLLALLAACAAEAQPTAAWSQEVVVVDGDTLRVGGERVRIANIDAPELPPSAKCWAEAALSLQAAEALQGYADRSAGLRLERDGVDRYGRTLARVKVGEVDVGEALIDRGLAARWTGRKWDWCASPDWTRQGGPELTGGPEGNAGYVGWAARKKADEFAAALAREALSSPEE